MHLPEAVGSFIFGDCVISVHGSGMQQHCLVHKCQQLRARNAELGTSDAHCRSTARTALKVVYVVRSYQ